MFQMSIKHKWSKVQAMTELELLTGPSPVRVEHHPYH